jgi:Phosphorylase superfamily
VRTLWRFRLAMVVVAATRLEARAARRALRGAGVEVVRIGVGGARLWVADAAGPIVVVGLCGALVPLEPGTVVVPDEVEEPPNPAVRCDPDLVAGLRGAVTARGWPLVGGRQLTAKSILRGSERARWAAEGFETVDMEAAPTLKGAPGAVVRVVLDAPDHELPALSQLPDPRSWTAMAQVALRAPLYARRAALPVADMVATWTRDG